MARTLRGLGLGSVSLYAVIFTATLSSATAARETEDAFRATPVTGATAVVMTFVRPAQRPVALPVVAQVSRAELVATSPILSAEPQDRTRIRQSWAIGVFR